MKLYLAKKDETIQQHTDKVVERAKEICHIYKNKYIDGNLLIIASTYHDFGKVDRIFQKRINGSNINIKVPHNYISTAFVPLTDNEINDRIVLQSVYYHHNRDNISPIVLKDYLTNFIKEDIEEFTYKNEVCNTENINLNTRFIKYILEQNRISYNALNDNEISLDTYGKYVMTKGLLHRADYAASAGIPIEVKGDDYCKCVANNFKDTGKTFNELQLYMKDNQDKNIVAIASTGYGKTEAGLCWLGNGKGFFILPLKVQNNSTYERIKDKYSTKVSLLHSGNSSVFIKRDEFKDINISAIKQFTEPLTVCTLDQIVGFVFRYETYEMKLATLANSKLIIDEIQMYSPNIVGILLCALKQISELGGKFAILTATFPPFISHFLEILNIKIEDKKTFLKNTIRHRVKIKEQEINTNDIINKYNKNKILVIVNTVKKAQELYAEITSRNIENVYLLHAKFINQDRNKNEEIALKLGNKNNKDYGIFISTQIVEASLNIDFDLLFTELSEINSLLQRMGRCFRDRILKELYYNVFVYINNCSGVPYVVDKDIFNLSRQAIKDIDGILTEEEKLKLIDKVYSYDIIKYTDYYKKIKDTIDTINNVIDYETDKNSLKIRETINNKNIIPLCIYKENKEEIDYIIENYDGMQNVEKIKYRDKLFNYVVSLEKYICDKYSEVFTIKLKNEEISVLDVPYNHSIGLVL